MFLICFVFYPCFFENYLQQDITNAHIKSIRRNMHLNFKRMLEQNEFKQCLLRFDDNKVLKVQLDMLISVQVCRTIDKNLNV